MDVAATEVDFKGRDRPWTWIRGRWCAATPKDLVGVDGWRCRSARAYGVRVTEVRCECRTLTNWV